MFRSYRIKRPAFGLAVVAVSLLLLAAFTLGLIYIKNNYNEARQYDRTADPDPRYQACLKIPIVIDTCTQKYEASDEKKRDDDDLAAQQEMADWSFIMAAASIFGLILSFGGLILVYRTLQKTAEAVKLTNRQLIIENRPWIRIEPREASDVYFMKDGGHLSVQVLFNNIGNSPALGLAMDCAEIIETAENDIVVLMERFKEKVRINYEKSEMRGQTVFPNETGALNGGLTLSLQTVTASFRDPNRPRIRLFSPSFIFSVVYRSAIDDTIFQTTIVMVLIEDNPDGLMHSIPIDDADIPRPIPFMQLHLMPYPGTYEAT